MFFISVDSHPQHNSLTLELCQHFHILYSKVCLNKWDDSVFVLENIVFYIPANAVCFVKIILGFMETFPDFWVVPLHTRSYYSLLSFSSSSFFVIFFPTFISQPSVVFSSFVQLMRCHLFKLIIVINILNYKYIIFWSAKCRGDSPNVYNPWMLDENITIKYLKSRNQEGYCICNPCNAFTGCLLLSDCWLSFSLSSYPPPSPS